ncbi:MAG: outer membrane protein transport protein [Woeseiaceae bacterium]
MLLNKKVFAISLLTSLISTNISASGFAVAEHSASGLGSAFAGASAIAEDASTTYFNPAGLSKLKGEQVVVAGHIVVVSSPFTNNGSTLSTAVPFGTGGALSGSNDDGSTTPFIPNFYYSKELNERWTLGFGINAPFGNASEYSDTWVGRYHATTSDITTINFNPSASYKVNKGLSVGFGVNVQYIEATLANQLDSSLICKGAVTKAQIAGGATQANAVIAANATCSSAPIGLGTIGDVTTDSSVSLNGDDWSLGWNIGLLYDISDATRIGLAYRSNVKHSLSGTADFTRGGNLGLILTTSTAFTSTGISSGIDLPESLSLSLYHEVDSKWSILADATWTKWSNFDTLDVDFSDPLQTDSSTPENWGNSMRYSFGVNYKPDSKWIYRAGLALDETPIPTAEDVTARIPDNDRIWLSLGLGHKLSDTLGFDVGYAHLVFDDITINNTIPVVGHTLTGSYKVDVDIFSAQMNWNF